MAKPTAPPPSAGTMVSVLYAAGMASLFVGERLIGSGPGRGLSVVGLVAVVAAFAWRIARVRSAEHERRQVEEIVAGLYAVGLFAVLLYGVGSDVGANLLGGALDRSSPKLATSLQAIWPALFAPSALALILVEMAAASVWRAPRLELGRIHGQQRVRVHGLPQHP